jgi:glycosyltransferase involved in cell wall biosynthesis
VSDPGVLKSQLLVDFAASGHHPKYLRQLVRYGLETEAGRHTRLLISRDLLARTEQELTHTERMVLRERTSLIEEQPAYVRLVKWIGRTAIVERLFVEYLIATIPPGCELVFLYMDPFLFQLACLPLPRKCVSGLLFRTSFHYRDGGFRLDGLRERLLFLTKYAICYLCARRSGVNRIFVLDPFAQSYAEKNWSTTKYITIPDPVGPDPGNPASAFPTRKRDGDGRRVLLLCGELSRRKGVLVVLRALAKLEPHYLRQLRLRLVGPIHGPERDILLQELSYMRQNHGSADITLADRFCTGDEFDGCILESDVVLTLYERSFGSSATVIRAAVFGRPVIATDQGLVGRLVQVHRAGAVVNVRDLSAVARAFRNFIDCGVIEEFDAETALEYANSCAPTVFAVRMLASQLGQGCSTAVQHQKTLT